MLIITIIIGILHVPNYARACNSDRQPIVTPVVLQCFSDGNYWTKIQDIHGSVFPDVLHRWLFHRHRSIIRHKGMEDLSLHCFHTIHCHVAVDIVGRFIRETCYKYVSI